MKQMSYDTALRLLGRDDSRLVRALDQLASGAIFVGAVFTGGAALTLVDAKSDLVAHGRELSRRVATARLGLHGRERSELLIAAHTVIVFTAYLEKLGSCAFGHHDRITDADVRRITDLIARQQQEARSAKRVKDREVAELLPKVNSIAQRPIPHPHPARPFEELVTAIRGLYQEFTDEVGKALETTELWNRISESDRITAPARLAQVADEAVAVYRSLYCRLAADCPEFFFWANLQDSIATRAAIRRLDDDVQARLAELAADVDGVRSGMADIPRLLRAAGASAESHAMTSLGQRAVTAVLGPSIDAPAVANRMLRIPSIRDSYVNPSGRVASDAADRQVADERWWRHERLVADLQRDIVAALIGPDAAEAPTVVLGEPGAGKSLLVKVLSASLSQSGLVAVRVVLRKTDPRAPIQVQIEDAVEAATGERISWPELVRSAPDAGRVILFDGFDELLQVVDAGQSDYLERVREFQLREQELGRPVATVVTSRTIVANQVRYPSESQVIRLEPFDDAQIALWVDRWNQTNRSYFASSDNAPLDPQPLMTRHADLARQPLLLLMLALYDAEGNPLQAQADDVPAAMLYRTLLARFVDREVATWHAGLADTGRAQRIDHEMARLSAVAFAMFNRGRQSITDEELNGDLAALGLAAPGLPDPTIQLISRFFFIHDSTARVKGRLRSTYEFLHATFGEYLVACHTVRLLDELADRGKQADHAVLRSLLSFTPLTSRPAVLAFTHDELSLLEPARRKRARRYAARLFRKIRGTAGGEQYRPVNRNQVRQEAIFTVNLMLLAVASAEGPVELAELVGKAKRSVETWSRLCLYWRSQLSTDEWRGVATALHMERADDGEIIRARISVAPGFGGATEPPVGQLGSGAYTDRWLQLDYLHRYLERHRPAHPDEVRTALTDLWLTCETHVGDLFMLMGTGPHSY